MSFFEQVFGSLTHNNAAPAATNLGALVAVASSAAPTYNAGDQVLLSVDLAGNLRTIITNTPAVAQSGVWSVEVNDGTNVVFTSAHPAYVQGTVAAIQSGTWSVDAIQSGSWAVTISSGAVTSTDNITEWNSVALGSPTVYGTPPTGNVIGVNAYVTTLPSVTGTVTAEIVGYAGIALDAVLGATRPANVLQVGGNDGINAYALPLASGGDKLLVTADAITIAAAQTIAVTNAGTFAVQASSSLVSVVSETWVSGTPGTTASITVTGFDIAMVTLNGSGTISTGVATYETSDDGGTTWYPIHGKVVSSFSNPTTTTLSTTLQAIQFNVSGLTSFRVRNSTTITGSGGQVIVRVQASNAASVPSVIVGQTSASNLNATVIGTLSTNNAAPSSNNIGVLSAVTTAAPAATPIEGDMEVLSTDSQGNLRVTPGGFPQIIQKNSGTSTGSVSSISVAYSSNCKLNTTLVVVCAVGTNTAPVITDSPNGGSSNTWFQAVLQANSTSFAVAIFYAINKAAGANTVTVTQGAGTSSIAAEVYEMAGLYNLAPSAIDGVTSNFGTGTALSAQPFMPTAGNEYAFAGFAVGTAAQTITVTAGSQNWVNDSGQLNPTTPAGLFSLVSSSAFSSSLYDLTPAATISSEPWACAMAVFKSVTLEVTGTVADRPASPTSANWLQAAISFSSSGDNVIVTGMTGQTIRVMRMFFVNTNTSTATNITIKDSTPTSFSGAFLLNSGGSFNGGPSGEPLYVTASGKSFEINSSGAVQISGTVWYTMS